MCIICVDLDRGKLTPWEASRNRTEMLPVLDKDHLEELDKKITEALHEYLESLKGGNSSEEEEHCGHHSK